MFKEKILEELSKKWAKIFASSPVKDWEKNLKAMMSSLFEKLELVSREEFEVQIELLTRTREKLSELEERVQVLERGSSVEKSALQDEL